MITDDIKAKSNYLYGGVDTRKILSTLFSDGTLAMLLFRFSQWLCKYKLRPLGFLVARLNFFLNAIVIGLDAKVDGGFVIMHSAGIVINGKAVIGANVVLQSGVVIGAKRRRSPIIGQSVEIGAGAVIIGDVRVGDNVTIGANAVVVKDVPCNSIAIGVPAKTVLSKKQ